MLFRVVVALCFTLHELGVDAAKPNELVEVCEREEFAAECGSGEVILMRMAQYGRMRLGRCVKRNYGSLGCAADVLPVVHTFCSGKQKCSFPITDLHKPSSGCPAELISYMQASYDCIKVAQCQSNLCEAGDFLKITSPDGYLASTVTTETQCGSATCPWMLDPRPGQSFNLTFYNFMGRIEPNMCMALATVVEKNSDLSRDVNFCGDNTVITMVTSASSPVEIRMRVPRLSSSSSDNTGRFLVSYGVVGCPDPPVPLGGWVQREDNATVHLGCDHGPAQWTMTCVGGNWVGKVGACLNGNGASNPGGWGTGVDGEDNRSTGGLLVVIGAGVALGVVLGFVMLSLAILYMKRKQRLQAYRRREVLMMPGDLTDDRSHLGSKYYERSPNSEKIIATSDCYSYSTYSTRDARAQPTPKALPVQIPETPSMYYGQEAGTLPRDHMYEYPAFVGPNCHTQLRNNNTDAAVL